MDYIKPDDLVANMGNAGVAKAKLAIKDMLIRGALSGMILGVATTLAFQTRIEFAKNVMGGVIFPVGFVMIVLLGLELVTGNFAVLPVSLMQKKITLADLGRNWSWVFLGNLIGALIFAGLFMATTKSGTPVVDQIKAVAVAKTVALSERGLDRHEGSLLQGHAVQLARHHGRSHGVSRPTRPSARSARCGCRS